MKVLFVFKVTQQFTKNTLGDGSKTGNEFKYQIKLQNTNTTRGMGMVVMIFRLPSCLEVNFPLLDGMLGNGVFDMYEVVNSNTEVVLYWRQFANKETKKFNLGFVQSYAGECYEKPHNAYMYYNDDAPVWRLAE